MQHAFLPNVEPIAADMAVADLFGQVAQAPCALPVLGPLGEFQGAISKTTLLKFLDRLLCMVFFGLSLGLGTLLVQVEAWAARLQRPPGVIPMLMVLATMEVAANCCSPSSCSISACKLRLT